MALSRITKVGGNSLESPLNFTGIVSATDASFSGVVTATSFIGDGSNLTGISGFSDALSNNTSSLLNQVFKTTQSYTVGSATSVTIQSDLASGNIAFTKLSSIVVSSGSTVRVATGTTFIMNVLGVF
jgi:hypothetical protein